MRALSHYWRLTRADPGASGKMRLRSDPEYGQALGALASSYMFAAHMGLDRHAGGNVEIELHPPAGNRPPGIAEGDLARSVPRLASANKLCAPAPSQLHASQQRRWKPSSSAKPRPDGRVRFAKTLTRPPQALLAEALIADLPSARTLADTVLIYPVERLGADIHSSMMLVAEPKVPVIRHAAGPRVRIRLPPAGSRSLQ